MTSERNPGRTTSFFSNPWLPHLQVNISDFEASLEHALNLSYGATGLWDVRVFQRNAYEWRIAVGVFDVGIDIVIDTTQIRHASAGHQARYIGDEVSMHVSRMINNLDFPAPARCDARTRLSMYAQYRGYAYNNAPQVRVVPFPQDANNQLLIAKLLELYLEQRVVIDCHEIRIGSGIGEMVFTSPEALRAYLEEVARNRPRALPVPQVTTSHIRRVEL